MTWQLATKGATMTDRKPMQLRLPPDLKAWLKDQAEKNGASQNSEVIRALRTAMDRTDVAKIRAEADAMQAHADLLEAEGLGGFTAPTMPLTTN